MQFAADGGSPIFRAFLPGVGKENLQETPIRLAVKTMVSRRISLSVALGSLVLVICFVSTPQAEDELSLRRILSAKDALLKPKDWMIQTRITWILEDTAMLQLHVQT